MMIDTRGFKGRGERRENVVIARPSTTILSITPSRIDHGLTWRGREEGG